MSKAVIVSALVALAQARFGQEQVPCPAIQALGAFGNPGAAGTLAGQCPGTLLAGANACDKLSLADDIITQLGTDPQVIAAAQGLVAAEKNFNPFAEDIPTICSEAGLPSSVELQGIIPSVDPAVEGSDVQNANSAASLDNPLDAAGGSVADLSSKLLCSSRVFSPDVSCGKMLIRPAVDGGFSNFTTQDVGGAKAAAVAGAGAGAGAVAAGGAADNANDNAGAQANQCAGAAAQADDDEAEADDEEAEADDNAGANAGVQQSSIAGLDFGKCVPTIDFVLGRPGRQPDEGTFLPTDALVAQGQQEALNVNIIINRVCDQLTNVCDANQAAKDACDQAQADAAALPAKDPATGDFFNQALGFA